MSSMTDNRIVEDFDDNGVDDSDSNLRHTSLRNALVSLNKTIQSRGVMSSHPTIKPVDRELLAEIDSTIKQLELFRWQILSERVEEGHLQHKRDSGISSARGSLRISQLGSVEDEQESTMSNSFNSPEQNRQTPDPSSIKEQTILESEADNRIKAADNTIRSQENNDRQDIQLYQLIESKGTNGNSGYNFVPIESTPAFKSSEKGFPPDRTHETKKELPVQVIHGLDSAAECRRWQEHNESPNQCVHLRIAVSECNLHDVKFSLGSQSTDDISQQTAEVYDPSIAIHNPSLTPQDPTPTSKSQPGHSMNLLKTLATKSLPSKLCELTEDCNVQRSDSTASFSLQDIADMYRLKILLTDNTFGLYELHLLKPVSSSESTEVKYIIGEESESNVNVKEETRGVIAADKRGFDAKEGNEKIADVKEDKTNDLSKHSNEDNREASILKSASECDFLRHELVRKT